MDTRQKIVPFETLRWLVRRSDWFVVPGLFDPMTDSQAQRLGQYAQDGRKLAVVVIDRPGTLLDAESRAVLVAALRVVSAVSIADEAAWANASFDCETVAYDDALERRLTSDFVSVVAKRVAMNAS